jgi:hypothetical protein
VEVFRGAELHRRGASDRQTLIRSESMSSASPCLTYGQRELTDSHGERPKAGGSGRFRVRGLGWLVKGHRPGSAASDFGGPNKASVGSGAFVRGSNIRSAS